jgi:hypothetical protein
MFAQVTAERCVDLQPDCAALLLNSEQGQVVLEMHFGDGPRNLHWWHWYLSGEDWFLET